MIPEIKKNWFELKKIKYKEQFILSTKLISMINKVKLNEMGLHPVSNKYHWMIKLNQMWEPVYYLYQIDINKWQSQIEWNGLHPILNKY